MQTTTWASLHSNLQNMLPLDLPELKTLSFVNKHWRTFALQRMLPCVAQNRYSLERLGFIDSTVNMLLKEYGSSLSYLETNKQKFYRASLCTNLQHLSLRRLWMLDYSVSEEELISLTNNHNRTTLTSLNLSHNNPITLMAIQSLGSSFVSLQELNLTKCDLTPVLVSAIASSCTALIKLNLNHNPRLGIQGATSLKALSNTLTFLNVNCCELKNAGAIEILTSFTALKTLIISLNHLTDVTARFLPNCPRRPSLTELDISYNDLTFVGEGLFASHFVGLKSLTLFNRKSINHPICTISKLLTSLTHLDLSRCQISERSYQSLATMTHLKSLNLSSTPGACIHVLTTLTGLNVLGLANCSISLSTVMTIGDAFPSLETLDLTENNFRSVEVVYLANSRTGLTSLTLGDKGIDDEALEAILKIPTLTYLEISNSSITKEKNFNVTKLFKEKGHHISLG